jgi:hypothetical protein
LTIFDVGANIGEYSKLLIDSLWWSTTRSNLISELDTPALLGTVSTKTL